SVIRRCWLNVRLHRERTWPVIYEYTLETDLARFAYDNWTDLLYAPLRANYKPRLSWRGSFFVPPGSELGGLSHRPPACPEGIPLALGQACHKNIKYTKTHG